VAASALDLARYALALLGGGTLAGARVLSPASVAELWRPQAAAAPGSSYGLGWRIETLDGLAVRRHSGAVSNSLAELVLVPELALGAVVSLNAGNGLLEGRASRLASGVVQLLVGRSKPGRGLWLWGVYALVDAVLLALSGYQLWSVGALLRSGSARQRQVLSRAALCEVGLAAAAARWIPHLVDAPWSLLRVYVPDLTCWLDAFCGCSLLKCLVLLGRWLRSWRKAGCAARRLRR
jgi:CubicO group peptidase (beta-lactamase class C family)